MNALDRKLRRDMVRLKGQAIAIALVMACGVTTLVASLGTQNSLEATRAAYYERFRFAHVFATATRAPDSLLARIGRIEGVSGVGARVAAAGIADVRGFIEPVAVRTVSLDARAARPLNGLYLRRGRMPEDGHGDEVAVDDNFAEAHGLRPGDTLSVTVLGTKHTFRIVGTALSPEFIYAIAPGDIIPDPKRFAVVWAPEPALAAMTDMEGAFNDLVLMLLSGTDPRGVIEAVDEILDPYGGAGAIAREHQVSHSFLQAELDQLDALARIVPPVFLLVAAFLVQMTLTRLVALEREEIGLLKALGYRSGTIAMHYVKLALLVGVVGAAIGVAAGIWLGRGLTALHAENYRFPFLIFRPNAALYVFSIALAGGTALAGALGAVRRVLALAPAVAMSPPAPLAYRTLALERALFAFLSPPARMALRHLTRHPLRSSLASIGVAASAGLLITAFYNLDALDEMIDVTFFLTERQDATLALAEPAGPAALSAARRLPGVLRAEPVLTIPATLSKGPRERKVGIRGSPRAPALGRILDGDLKPVTLPPHGLVVSERLASVLDVEAGETVRVQVLSGARREAEVPLRAVIRSYFGLAAYMDIDALARLTGTGPRLNAVNLDLDEARVPDLYAAAKETPSIAGLSLLKRVLAEFRGTVSKNIRIMIALYVTLGSVIAFGVVYNAARISLSERARELASLRVLGFTRAEASGILMRELGVVVLVGIPFGFAFGTLLAWIASGVFSSDLYTLPFIILPHTFARSALVVLVAAFVSALLVRRRIDRLNLIAVLKTRE